MLLGKGPEYCGKILVCSIGIPDALIVTVEDHLQAVHSSDAALYFPPEPWNSFKNQRGHVLVVGGSADYPGAPFLSG
jgi:NAD(P)H-hydrate epimerase